LIKEGKKALYSSPGIIKKGFFDSFAQEGDDAKTEEEILSLIAQHVKAVNRIYQETPFDGRYKHNGYQFEVQRIKIHNDSGCEKQLHLAENSNHPVGRRKKNQPFIVLFQAKLVYFL
jgi:hypothetical protein